jgi:hypothetical protein
MESSRPIAGLLNELDEFAVELKEMLDMPDIDWQCCPDAGEWSLTEVICHLRDVEREVHQPRFRQVLAQDGAFLVGAVADDWVEQRAYRQQDGPKALSDFIAARTETLELLRPLAPSDWEREGQHSFLGPMTMHELLNLVAQHDQAHREQVYKLLRVQ